VVPVTELLARDKLQKLVKTVAFQLDISTESSQVKKR
jgi:hypothetical protein